MAKLVLHYNYYKHCTGLSDFRSIRLFSVVKSIPGIAEESCRMPDVYSLVSRLTCAVEYTVLEVLFSYYFCLRD